MDMHLDIYQNPLIERALTRPGWRFLPDDLPFPELLPSAAKPKKTKLFVFDFDGNLVETYPTLRMASEIMDYYSPGIKDCSGAQDDIIAEFYRRYDRDAQKVLHQPELTLRRFANLMDWATGDRRIREWQPRKKKSHRQLIEDISKIAIAASKPDEDYIELANMVKNAGTAKALFTNTDLYDAAERLAMTGLPPDHFAIICAKEPKEGSARPLTGLALEFAECTVTYLPGKPNRQVIPKMQRLFGVTPDEIIYTGDSLSDVNSAYGPGGKWKVCHLGVNLKGARRSEIEVVTNRRIRGDDHPIGEESLIESGVLEWPGIIVMDAGFRTIIQMINNGSFDLERTPIVPHIPRSPEHLPSFEYHPRYPSRRDALAQPAVA